MKVSGIICEYNPFHNGHLYHINETRRNGATHIVAVMSGNFVQRGDVAIADKFERAKLAVDCGVDLVIELPVAYSLASAEYFARGAVFLLKSVGCVDELSFGSECGDLSLLVKGAKATTQIQNSEELKNLLENGMSYPNAINTLAEEKFGKEIGELLSGSNNLLAIEYIKAISFLHANITPFTVQRKSAMHDEGTPSGEYASASYIRQCISEGTEFSDLVPEQTMKFVHILHKKGKIARIENLERAILYKMRTSSISEIENLPDIGQGLENRIYTARNACSLEELLFAVKTKRYTMSKVRRLLCNLLIGITKDDFVQPPPYGRILAINERGRDILSEAQGKAKIPFATSLSKLGELNESAKHFTELESRATDIYNLATKVIRPTERDYRAKIGLQ